jgi:N-acetyl sugar amidotransferase
MKYCTRCLNPANHPYGLTFDDQGVCSGCRVHEEKDKINYAERWNILVDLVDKYRNKDGSNYDCIIGISGGKDSHFITHIVKNELKLNPLLVTYNHQYNTKAGLRNMKNLVQKFDCDHIRFTQKMSTIKKLARVSLRKMGDICWHCHTGIGTYPIQIAVKYKIPLIIWGDHGNQDMVGQFSHHDMVEWSKKVRQEHSMRGFDWFDFVGEEGLTRADMIPYVYPSDEELEEVGVRGIYLGNFLNWNAKKQAEIMIRDYDFESCPQERTNNCYENVECWHCSGAHDYLKYLKFGYGRATDCANYDIRFGRITREMGIELVKNYDSKRPHDLDILLNFLEMTEDEFVKIIDSMRDPAIWHKDSDEKWHVKDSVCNHVHDAYVDDVRVSLKNDECGEYITTKQKNEPSDNEHIFM